MAQNPYDQYTQRRALVGQMADAPPPAQQPAGGGDRIQAASIYATTPEQNDAIQKAQNDLISRQKEAAAKDQAYLGSLGGRSAPADWVSESSKLPAGINIQDFIGPDAKPAVMPGDSEGPGGISGRGTGAEAPTAAPVTAGDFSRLEGYDLGKFNDPNKQSAKYQMARVLSQFDPTQGVTPEVVAALNKLGLGTFSGSGDKLNLGDLTDAGRAAGLKGGYSGADFIKGFKSGKGKWQYSDPFVEAQEAAAGGGAAPGAAGGGGMLPPTSGLSGLDSAFFQKLLAQGQGQLPQGALNREALLSMIGGG